MEETLERLDCEHHDKETKLGEEVKKEKSKLSKILIALELQKPRNWEQEYLNLHEEYNQKVDDCWNAASPQERETKVSRFGSNQKRWRIFSSSRKCGRSAMAHQHSNPNYRKKCVSTV